MNYKQLKVDPSVGQKLIIKVVFDYHPAKFAALDFCGDPGLKIKHHDLLR